MAVGGAVGFVGTVVADYAERASKEDIKIKLHFIKGKQSRSDLQVAITESD